MAWTRQQNHVIAHRGSNLLVSAAAGSGKTAVLVERILQRITDPAHPADIDRILVVTFTKAAAAEMRERIADALSARLEEAPEDANLQRQWALLPNAKISTIDSFCQSVIRNQFYRIDLEPVNRVGDEGEMKVMRQDVLGDLLEERYARGDEALIRLAGHFSKDRNDEELKKVILQVYDYAMSEPWPRRWLEECRRMYRGFGGGAQEKQETEASGDVGSDVTAAQAPERTGQGAAASDGADWTASPWMRLVTENIRAQISGIADAFSALIAQARSPRGPYMYEYALSEDERQLREAAAATDFSGLRRSVNAFEKKRINAKDPNAPKRQNKKKEKPEVDPNLQKQVKKERDDLLKPVLSLQKDFFAPDPAQLCSQMRDAAADAEALCDLTGAFMDAFSAKKRSGNILDFSDLEHDALKILVDEETGLPTEAAREYQDFFEEIMIDEYQDSNYVQELLLMSISRQQSEHPNVFMVGDVKQSIYGFRLARPDLFMEKYRTYAQEEAEKAVPSAAGRRIVLHTNFRSRPGVLRSVNAVFSRLMQEDVGGITYGKEEALYPGEGIYPPQEDAADDPYRTEILLTDKGIDAETALIARRIRQLTDPACPLMITDKGADAPRPVRYHDIVILMRSVSGKGDKMAQQLNDAGIPAHVQSRTGYFASLEVRTILSFLQVIDNPRQDIPLAAALRSPVYGLRGEDLAQIRIGSPDTDFYDAVIRYAAEGPDDALREKLNGFLADLADYREKSRSLQIHALLAYLLRRSGYDKIVSTMSGAEARLTNLRMLQERAAAFEETSYHGLFQFNRYMEQLDTYDVDYGEASAVGENDDAVRILTIHQSKGLEYPVVFLSGLGAKFNKKDLSGKVLLHARYGIGIDVFYPDRRTKTPTILKKAIRLMNETESAGEEMRVLYVGMTRAREKLILTAAGNRDAGEKEAEGKKAENTAENWADRLRMPPGPDAERPLDFYRRLKAGCFMDWISRALSGAGKEVCHVEYIPAEDLARSDARQIAARRMRRTELEALADTADAALTARLAAHFEAAHTQVQAQLPAKVSVSELKLERIRENGEDPEELFAGTHQKVYVPSFARECSDADAAAGASYGTAVHRVMECLDFAACAAVLDTGEAAQAAGAGGSVPSDAALRNGGPSARGLSAARAVLDAQLDRMRSDGRISREVCDMVSRRALAAFLCSDLFRRMAQADRQGLLVKERPFVMQVSAREALSDAPEKETVLVQGIIDAYFEEDGHIILVDYKTDRVDEAVQLTDRYRRQMELYAQALTGGSGKEVSQMLLYSFALDREVPV